MWMSGTIDPNGLAGGPSLTTSGPDNQFTWTTYMERLQAAGISWKIYRQPGTLTGAAAISKWTQFGTAQPGNPLFDNGVATQPLGQFEYDAMNDQLPTVSWILPPAGFDEHPAALPAAGATFVAGKIDAIAANPEVWAKTVFILSYDENDGMFDHVMPPTPPAGTANEFVFKTSNTGVDGGGLPVGLGFRVPAIIVSPVDHRRLRVLRDLRPHLPTALPRTPHRRDRDQHQRLAARDGRRPDGGIPVQRPQPAPGAA